MKKVLFYGFALIGIGLVAQTNTFPDTGKVGIGITNPLAPLDLVGAFGIRESASSLTNGDVRLYNHSGSTWGFIIRPFDSSFNGGTWDWNQDFGYRADSKTWFVDTNFGIGTSVPDSRLHITNGGQQIKFGTGSNSSSYVLSIGVNNDGVNIANSSNVRGFNFRNNTGELLKIAHTGNVGIGTSTPDSRLHVKNGGQQIKFGTGSNSSGYILSIGVNNDGVNLTNNSYVRGFNFKNGTGELMKITHSGNVGIGTTAPDAKLTVKGQIHALEVKVDLDGALAPDYVFYEDYDLRSLDEVQKYIDENGHLPNIPSADEIEKDGLHLKEMNLKLLEKVEELTLYVLQQQKQIKANASVKMELDSLKQSYEEVLTRITKLENQNHEEFKNEK